jgi:hypothetical protein
MDRRRAVRPAASSNGRAEPAAISSHAASRSGDAPYSRPQSELSGHDAAASCMWARSQRRDDGTLCKRVIRLYERPSRTSRLRRRSMFFKRQASAPGHGDPRQRSATFWIDRQRHGRASFSRWHAPHDLLRADMLSSPMPGRTIRLASVVSIWRHARRPAKGNRAPRGCMVCALRRWRPLQSATAG